MTFASGADTEAVLPASDVEALLPASDVREQKQPRNGVVQTALLVIANCAGAGLLSTPKAVNQAGLAGGIFLILFAALLSAYTADVLGRCYAIIARRGSQPSTAGGGAAGASSKDSCGDQQAAFFARSPYASVAQHATGRTGAIAVTVAQVTTQFSVMVLFFLISGVNLHKLCSSHTSLFFSLLCCAALAPLLLLRPGHVWGTAVFAILASVILVVVVIVLCATGAKHDSYIATPPVTFATLGSAFGVILFGFGGHAILPALQAAMRNPTPARFRRSIGWSFGICTAMYLGTAVSSVLTLGGAVSGDVLTNFSGNVNDFGLIAVTTHLLFAAITVHIPLGQIVDHYAGVTSDFSGRQVALRVATMAIVAAVIWIVGDRFYCVIGLVGGTCNNAMIFIFPPWFYYRLTPVGERSRALLIRVGCIIFVGTAGMVSALIGAADTC